MSLKYTVSDEAVRALSFTKNPAWDFIQEVLTANIQNEVAIAISSGISPEARAHAAGRADSLVDFQNYINDCRQIAVDKTKSVQQG